MSCNCNNNCGCQEQPYTTPDLPQSCSGEICTEMFCADCIINCQPEMHVSDGDDNILTMTQGMRLNEMIQRMMLFLSAPDCVATAPIGLRFISKTNTTITIKWKKETSVNYTLRYTVNNVNTNIAVGNVEQYTIMNLIPDTEYLISVLNTDTGCQSVIFKIRTNA